MASVLNNHVAGSKRNHSTQTFDGVDVMGERLAEEVCVSFSRLLLFQCCFSLMLYCLSLG